VSCARATRVDGWTELERVVQAREKDRELQVEQKQSLKQQIATDESSRVGQGQVKSQIVAQAQMEALRESVMRKSTPAASGFATGTTVLMPVDRNPFKKPHHSGWVNVRTASKQGGKKILKRILEMPVPVFPDALDSEWHAVRRRKEEKEKNSFGCRPSNSSG